jgi:antirestriction protein ArdC
MDSHPPRCRPPEIARVQTAENFFAALRAGIRHGGHRACYLPKTDHIQMPRFEVFQSALAYYSTLAHEWTHWTGAVPRLNRELSTRFGGEPYAAEELIAELGAAFLCAELGLSNEPRPDHAAYLASWLRVLKNDKRAIFTAASKTEAAVDYMHGKQEEERLMSEFQTASSAIHPGLVRGGKENPIASRQQSNTNCTSTSDMSMNCTTTTYGGGSQTNAVFPVFLRTAAANPRRRS